MGPSGGEPNRRSVKAAAPAFRARAGPRWHAGCRRRLRRHPPGAAMDTATLVWGVLFGAVGLGYFVYGKRQQAPIPLVCGLALMVFPYFVSTAWVTVLVGAALIAVPYFVRI
jgi:hypothetical protein